MATEVILATCNSVCQLEKPWNYNEAAEFFRTLRNICAEGQEIQSFICKRVDVLCKTKYFIEEALHLTDPVEAAVIAVTTGIQFLGNLIVNNTETAAVVWSLIKDDLILLCLKSENGKIRNYSSMVLLNSLLQCKGAIAELINLSSGKELIEKLVESSNDGSEFSLFVIQQCILKEPGLSELYQNLSLQTRVFLLEALHHALTANHTTDGVDLSVPPQFIQYLKEQFKKKCDILLQTFRDQSTLEPLEYSRILEILGFCSGSTAYRNLLQDDKSLLISSVYLLICFHQCGKSKEVGFTPIEDLSALAPGNKEELLENPTFCFKRDLIRLLANLAWKNKENQDEIRNMEAIPIILECCCIDARNPFMSQWCIMAVRNLCENNLENQKLIASMTEQGVVDSEVLQQMGFQVHEKRIRLH